MRKILSLSFVFLLLSGCSETTLVKKACPLLGTIVEIEVADKEKPRPVINRAVNLAFAEIERVEGLLSKFKSNSDIARINASGWIHPVKVSPETINLIEQTSSFSQLSGGAFDITVGPLLEIWGQGRHPASSLPDAQQINEALTRVGYQKIKIVLQEQTVFLTQAGMNLDLGGIAKGYAVDKAIGVLKQQGIKNALVNAGGDIYTLGSRSDKMKWRVAVQHPRREKAILTILDLQDKAVATSGDYQRYVEIGPTRYSHIINPKTGYSCQDVPASVTVIAADCLSADALATAIFVLGPEEGMALVNKLEDVEAIVVSVHEDKLHILVSRELTGKLRFEDLALERTEL